MTWNKHVWIKGVASDRCKFCGVYRERHKTNKSDFIQYATKKGMTIHEPECTKKNLVSRVWDQENFDKLEIARLQRL